MFPRLLTVALFAFITTPFVNGQVTVGEDNGYTGYNLTLNGRAEDVLFATNSTPPPANISTTNPPPDVFLNASVSVGEIDILVANLTAKINLDAAVLNLLKFNAGVDLSIDRVRLLIQNISAEVTLEARLENLVLMINDVLNSIDLNPVLATLGQGLNNITDTLTGGTTQQVTKRNVEGVDQDYDLVHNILFSTNDYSGHTHTNRVLAQNGDILDEALDDAGHVLGSTVVGNYATDMTFNGEVTTVDVDIDGTGTTQSLERRQYEYTPFPGLMVVSNVFIDAVGEVLKTQVLSEASGGGSSTIGEN